MEINSEDEEMIPLEVVLSLEKFYRGDKKGVILTWDVKQVKSDKSSKFKKYNECKEASSMKSMIKEYEIYGYKDILDKKEKNPWKMVGKFK